MSGLAEDHLDDKPARAWLIRGAIALGLIALVWVTIFAVKSLKTDDKPRRQVAKISILPDTPPPPPPPPKEEKKPEPPKDEPKQVMREEQLKTPEAPKAANEPLKMEGAAGDGPSAFAAGNVGKEYSGGPTTPAATPGAGGGTQSDRAQERFYANTARQLLRDEIERHLKSEAEVLTATFSLWLTQDGSIKSFELTPSGDPAADRALQAALDETRRALKLPPPPAIALSQPLRFKLSLRPLA